MRCNCEVPVLKKKAARQETVTVVPRIVGHLLKEVDHVQGRQPEKKNHRERGLQETKGVCLLMKLMRITLLVVLISANILCAEVLKVGPEETYKTLLDLPRRFEPGDVIELQPGIYRQFRQLPNAGTPENPVVIKCAVKWACTLDGGDFNFAFTPRAAFEVPNGAYTFQDIDFRNISNGGQNASAIRCIAGQCIIEGNRIRNVSMGIHGTAPTLTIIRHNDIQWNGFGNNSHQIYLSGGENAIIEDNIIAHTVGGMNVKVRTRLATIRRNTILDSRDGEVQCGNGPTTLQPGSDCLVENNVIRTLAKGRGNCCRVIAFGHEGSPGTDRNGVLRFLNNSITTRNNVQILVSLDSVNAGLEARGNIIEGTNKLLRIRYGTSGPVTAEGNFVRSAEGLLPIVGFPTLFEPPVGILPLSEAPAPAPTDTVKPTQPTELAATQSAKNIILTWNPSTDDGGISHYEIIMPYGPYSMGAEPTYTVITANYPGRSYTFSVVAVDFAGNRSEPSESITLIRQ